MGALACVRSQIRVQWVTRALLDTAPFYRRAAGGIEDPWGGGPVDRSCKAQPPLPGLLPRYPLGYSGLTTEKCGSHSYWQPSEAASSSALRGLDDQSSDTGYGVVLLHES